MSRPHEAYASAARIAPTDPRELEASVLLKAASQLQRIRDNWEGTPGRTLYDALVYNRKLWTVFATSVTEEESALPRETRQNIANLALFIFKHTLAIQTEPAPEALDTLININRQIAAGLLQKG